MYSRVCCEFAVIKLRPAFARPSQVDSNMFLARNRSHINAGRALLSRYYVHATHTRPVLTASTTPVEKILLDTIKVRDCSLFFEPSA